MGKTGIFLTKHKSLLAKSNATKAAYLFQPDKEYTDLDIGDMTIQCGRKPDCLKLWMMWKKLGDAGLAARVNSCVDTAELMESRIRASSNFQMVYPVSCKLFELKVLTLAFFNMQSFPARL